MGAIFTILFFIAVAWMAGLGVYFIERFNH